MQEIGTRIARKLRASERVAEGADSFAKVLKIGTIVAIYG